MNPLILGAATGYRPADIRNFVRSILSSGYNGEVSLLVDSENKDLSEYLNQHGIGVIPINTSPIWIPKFIIKRRFSGGRASTLHDLFHGFIKKCWSMTSGDKRFHIASRYIAPFHHIWESRHFYAFEYLKRHSNRWSHIMLTDVRDVVFQRDPFEFFPDDDLWVFAYNDLKIKDEPTNVGWVRRIFGDDVLEQVREQPILCAGTTIGSSARIIQYLKTMIETIVLSGGAHQVDQGVHNGIFHGKMLVSVMRTNDDGPIATLTMADSDLLRFNNEGFLLKPDGSPYAVLHQYDLIPGLLAAVEARLDTADALTVHSL